jgi:hypothetical protein
MSRAAHLIGLLCIASCAAPETSMPVPPDLPSSVPFVRVADRELTVAFPWDSTAVRARPSVVLPDAWAGPGWRVMIRPDTAVLTAVHQVYPDTSLTLPRYGSVTEVVRAGELRDCQLDDWILVCGKTLRGRTEVIDQRVVLRITDRAWIDHLRRSRPRYAHLGRQGAGPEPEYAESVAIQYFLP